MSNKTHKTSTPPPAPQGQIIQKTQQFFQGPLPQPSDMEHYERIMAGAANRIMVMAENESQHRHALELSETHAAQEAVKRQQWQNFSVTVLGQISALLIAIGGLVVGYLLFNSGHQWVGGFLGGFPILAIILAFLANRPKTKK